MTAQPKPTAAKVTTDVLREFSGRRSYADVADLVVRSLAAAGLLATAEHDAQVLRDAADEIRGWDADGGPRRARVARGVIANVAGYLDRRAKRIAGGAR